MTEGLLLKWKFVNLGDRNLTVEASKNYKTRHVPLSDYAIELLRSLPRVIGCEYVFAHALTKERWRDPREPFYAGRKAVGMEWVGFHDFRHFRASQWVMRGIDLGLFRNCWDIGISRRRCGTPISRQITRRKVSWRRIELRWKSFRRNPSP